MYLKKREHLSAIPAYISLLLFFCLLVHYQRQTLALQGLSIESKSTPPSCCEPGSPCSVEASSAVLSSTVAGYRLVVRLEGKLQQSTASTRLSGFGFARTALACLVLSDVALSAQWHQPVVSNTSVLPLLTDCSKARCPVAV